MDMANAAPDEQARLDALRSHGIPDTPPGSGFDHITRVASRICETPLATATLVDRRRQWFKSTVGPEIRETGRAIVFCADAVCGTSLSVAPDALMKHPLFKNNPLVVENPVLRFHAGMRLIAPSGFVLGTLAVMDRPPSRPSLKQGEALEARADQMMVGDLWFAVSAGSRCVWSAA